MTTPPEPDRTAGCPWPYVTRLSPIFVMSTHARARPRRHGWRRAPARSHRRHLLARGPFHVSRPLRRPHPTCRRARARSFCPVPMRAAIRELARSATAPSLAASPSVRFPVTLLIYVDASSSVWTLELIGVARVVGRGILVISRDRDETDGSIWPGLCDLPLLWASGIDQK